MGKKKKKHDYLSQAELRENLFIDEIYQQEMMTPEEFVSKLDLLLDNDKASASVVWGFATKNAIYATPYLVACKYIVDNNKDLKEKVIQKHEMLYNEYVDGSVKESENLNKIRKLGDTILDTGTYVADVGKCNYAILSIKTSEDGWSDYFTGKIYFVGKKHRKNKMKFDKICYDYNELSKDITKNQQIVNPYGKMVNTRFKPMTHLIFKDKERVLKYIDNFVDNIPKYYEYGITPKLSVLLYGKPGTGKSTFYKSLADYLDIKTVIQLPPEYFISGDGSENMQANQMGNGRKKIQDSMYVIDEIDCICESRDKNENGDGVKNAHILSDLLSFLDEPPTFNFKARDGKYYPISIVIATTNYYDRLDPAVKRSGRFDLKQEMVYFTTKEAEEMCNLYGLKLKDVYDGKIDDKVGISPAELQAFCMENIDKSLKGDEKQ